MFISPFRTPTTATPPSPPTTPTCRLSTSSSRTAGWRGKRQQQQQLSPLYDLTGLAAKQRKQDLYCQAKLFFNFPRDIFMPMHDAFNGANGINGDFGDDVWLHLPQKIFFQRAHIFKNKQGQTFVQRPAAVKTGLETFLVEKDLREKFGQRNLAREIWLYWHILSKKELWVGKRDDIISITNYWNWIPPWIKVWMRSIAT